MDFSHYSDEPAQIATDLVNTYEVFAEIEHLVSPADVARFFEENTEGWPHDAWDFSEQDLHEVRALRSRLRSVFVAEGTDDAAAELNRLLRDVGATPRVSLHKDHPHLHFEPTGASPARWLGAVTAMGLSVALIEGGPERLGVCSSSTCEDVFVDTSRNRSRRHCSDTCTTRENVAAYRARQKG